MPKYILIFLLSTIFISCKETSDLATIYHCKKTTLTPLETVTDAKKIFQVSLPKKWKINLYLNNQQSSIYAADTTLELSKTIILDVTYIQQNIKFDLAFKKKSYLTHYKNQLDEIISKEMIVLEKPAYLTISKGKKGNFSYQIAEIYIKINESNFMLVKIEIYGDLLIKKRFCNAFDLIDKIQLK